MFGFLEEKVKAYLSECGITRGKVDIYIGVDVLEQHGMEVMLDVEAARSYITALEKLRDTFELKDDISTMRVAQNHDLFIQKKPDDDVERDWEKIRPVLAEAIEGYNKMREKEGANLCRDILSKAEGMKASADKIREISAADISGYPAKLEQRIRQLLKDFDVETTEQRILTEAAIFADKAAIDEELVRLASHFVAFDEIVHSNEAAGRKLDFLVQEINREINTIGSKAVNADIAHLVVDMKTELEKIREQIQNLE
jgi:uncharacterized protein (TIGR00255 family)